MKRKIHPCDAENLSNKRNKINLISIDEYTEFNNRYIYTEESVNIYTHQAHLKP